MSVPSSPLEGENLADYSYMDSIRQVILYSGMTYKEVLSLPTDVFLLMRKNYIIERLQQTEEGRKYLEDCERLKQTEPDYNAIHKRYGEGEQYGKP